MKEKTTNASVERIGSLVAGLGQFPAMFTVHDVARVLSCSARTVYRLSDSGKMPRPIKLGKLVRWPRQTITNWIGQGCPKNK